MYLVGDIIKMKEGDIEILSYLNTKNIIVRFKETGYTLTVTKPQIVKGNIKDLLKPSIAGVGFIGKGYFNSFKDSSAYTRWMLMIRRCYDKESQDFNQYGRIGVTVCSDWHNFQNYCEFYYKNFIEGFEIDKDILSDHNNKIYSPETCLFIPRDLNASLQGELYIKTSNLPQGVTKHISKGKFRGYRSRITNPLTKQREHLGVFKTPEEAHHKYLNKKLYYIGQLAEYYYNNNIISRYIYNKLLDYTIEGRKVKDIYIPTGNKEAI